MKNMAGTQASRQLGDGAAAVFEAGRPGCQVRGFADGNPELRRLKLAGDGESGPASPGAEDKKMVRFVAAFPRRG